MVNAMFRYAGLASVRWLLPKPAKGPVHFSIEYRVARAIDFAFTVLSTTSNGTDRCYIQEGKKR
ncbi:hypothetical protein FHW16_003218 [Phyllobacterium myrsinacearum]|uniref:Uncharacterized protein n=1 Tax=Phyllobacterium myrsinacearum TaxID=28101 RepID=A0A839EKZ4_9HYPH|nr:hypothetical protein [Phyllobacterium myrsinacearum]